jgi:hypothetical protein
MPGNPSTAVAPKSKIQNGLKPGKNRRLRVVAYTDAAGIGGAEISLGHLVASVSEDIEIIVLGVSESVVKAIAARRSQAVAKILPAKGAWSMMAHLAALHQLHPDVVHCNLCRP